MTSGGKPNGNHTRKGNTTADLIAIGYPDLTTANAAADEARRLAAAIRK